MLRALRRLHAIAPSGGHVELVTYTGLPGELTWYQGKLTQAEDVTFQAACRRAQQGGLEGWSKARELLVALGWQVVEQVAP